MISKVLLKIAREFGRISGKEASDINTDLSYAKGFSAANDVLIRYGYRMGPKFKKNAHFIFDSNNNFVMNGYIDGDYQGFRIKPLDTREFIGNYLEEKSKIINQMEAQRSWEEQNES